MDQLVGEQVNQTYALSIIQISNHEINSMSIKVETTKYYKVLNDIIQNLKTRAVDSE